MKSRSTWIVLALLAAACNQPTAPSRMITGAGEFGIVAPRTKAIEMSRAGATWLQLGRVRFVSDEDAYYLFVDWDANDPDNQVPRKWNTASVKAGEFGDISMYVPDPLPGHCDQQDLYKFAGGVPNGTPDMSILRNYLWAANEHLLPPGCVPPQKTTSTTTTIPPTSTTTTTVPPYIVEPPCSEDRIESVSASHDAAMTIETVVAIVKTGMGGFKAFGNAFGLYNIFEFGLVPVPQARTTLAEWKLQDGTNIRQVPIAPRSIFKAWQFECGCDKAPNPLTDIHYGVQFTWFISCSDGANFQ